MYDFNYIIIIRIKIKMNIDFLVLFCFNLHKVMAVDRANN